MSSQIKCCGRCQKNLPTSEFAKNRAKKDGLQERCNSCRKAHYEDTAYRGVARERELLRKYGITQADYLEMYAQQSECCAICSKTEPTLFVDHCHKKGHVRGLLCSNCNRALGLMGDSPETMKNAMNYLKGMRYD